MVVLYENTAYVYFILMTILQCIPTISNTGGFPTLAPILLVLIGASSAMKLIEDRARRRDDIAQNTTVAHCKRGGAIRDETWTDVKVGDVVKITNHENIPADVLILAAHEPDPNVPRAACHVETKGLDGETNLKGKAAPGMLAARMGATLEAQLKAASQVSGYVECEQPNAATNKFAGNLHLAGEAKPEPITIGNMLLRGSSLRNTEYVLALVVNTGVDTKVMQGARKAPGKTSTLDKQTTDTVVICAALMTFLCFICTIGARAATNHAVGGWVVVPPPTPPLPPARASRLVVCPLPSRQRLARRRFRQRVVPLRRRRRQRRHHLLPERRVAQLVHLGDARPSHAPVKPPGSVHRPPTP